MALSKQRNSLYDPCREMWVAATPEEVVRQNLLHIMIHQLGYPKHFIAIEKQLRLIPNLAEKPPNRRADILCFFELAQELKPLLLIECKEFLPDEETKRQVLGYNHFVGAPFAAVAGPRYVALIYPEVLSFLPPYKQLKEAMCI